MKVYILIGDPYHDNSVVYGAYSTLEKAMSYFHDLEWEKEGPHIEGGRCGRRGCVAQADNDPNEHEECFLILERIVDAETP